MAMFKFEDDKDFDIQVAKLEIENEETFHLKNLYKLWQWQKAEDDVDPAKSDRWEQIQLEAVQGSTWEQADAMQLT